MTLEWAATIFYLSTGTFGGELSGAQLRSILQFLHVSVSPAQFEVLHHLFRKAGHVTEYAIFALFLYHCFLKSNRTFWQASAAKWSVMTAGMYSLTDEFHQRFVPGRGPSLYDCGLDTLAALLAVLAVLVWTRAFRPSRPPLPPVAPKPVVSGDAAV
jgi:VanZ family protein